MKNQKHSLTLWLVFFAIWTMISCTEQNELLAPPANLKTNYMENPLGIDQKPVFSWQIINHSRGALQGSYHLMVATSPEKLNNEEDTDVWNSGKINSNQSVQVTYNGSPLQSGTRYYWKVRTWNMDDNASPWSPVSWFETALLDSSQWQAQWIGLNQKQKPPRSIALRKEFSVDKDVASARIYVTGLGGYVMYINGQRVGKDLLTPGWTHYPEKLQYQTYDVTDQVKTGINAMGALLGNVWWSSGLGWQGGTSYADGPLQFLMQMHLEFEDGTKTVLVTDESWKMHESPILENTLYHGEHYDANLEQDGWHKPAFADASWQNADLITPENQVKLVAQQTQTMQITEQIKPVNITEVKPGIYVFDMGQNMVGITRLNLKGEKGQEVTLKYAELLHADGTVAQENLRSARATDKYICKGGPAESWQPQFTYHGFRYVQVEGLNQEPDENTLTGLVFHTNAPINGSFQSSNQLLNQIQKNIMWGMRGNLMSVPTDCPQRDERLGWMGDAQIFAATANYNMHLGSFWNKWQRDILDGQEPEGWVYDVNPPIVVGGPSKPGWGDAVVVVPWETYRYYGDKQILADSYEGMKAWVNYMKENSENHIYEWGDDEFGGYGDWVAVEKTPSKPIGAAYYYYSTKLMGQIARILNKVEDARYYEELAPQIAQAYHAKYYLPEQGEYVGQTQTANLLPLAFGIVPEELRDDIFQKIVEDVQEHDNHLTTGFLGTKYLLPILSENGYHELAYQVATQTTYPSWGYMVEKGATTMWELWNSDTERPEGMNSRNHFAYGSVGEWYYGYLAGIRPEFENGGYKKFIVAPQPIGDLEWVKAKVGSEYGEIESNWNKTESGLQLDVTVPANTQARLLIPKLGKDQPTIKEVEDILFQEGQLKGAKKGIRFIGENDNAIEFEIGSGKYLFEVI